MPIRQKSNIFLEVYGNCKVQKRTANYVESLGEKLKALMKNIDTRGREDLTGDILDLSLLRFRERDELEAVFSSYSKSTAVAMDKLIDQRQRYYHVFAYQLLLIQLLIQLILERALYQDRFDNRKALYDWDYHSCLKTKASIIHIKQYKGISAIPWSPPLS